MCFVCKFFKSHHRREILVKGTFQVTFTVEAPPLAVASPQDLGVAGTQLPDGAKLSISGGTPPYSLTNVTGTVPPGVTINSDGSLTGGPTSAGSFPVSIDVQDS